jgi:hypothetical protein
MKSIAYRKDFSMSAETSDQNRTVTIASHPKANESIKNVALLRKMIADYDPSKVDVQISASETMTGPNYLWVGAVAIEIIISSIGASRLTEVKNVLDLPWGHGRVLRHLVKLFPSAQVDACDLDRGGLEFCAERFGARPIHSREDLTSVGFDTI